MSDSEIIYLDHAAATPMDQRVMLAMQPFLSNDFYNPSSPYAPAVEIRRKLENARHRLAVCFGGKADEVVITAGATESIALAMTAAQGGHVVTSAIEHEAVLANARQYSHTIVPVGKCGIVSVSDIAAAITPKTTLVSIALANSELGTIQPLSDIARVVEKVRRERLERHDSTPIWLHTDASQGVGQLDISVARLGVDMLSLNAGKIYGPKQVGLLWRRGMICLQPVILGGGQEMGLRSGTENVAGVIGFATALELATAHRKSEVARLSMLRDQLEKSLMNHFPDMTVNGNAKKRLAGHLHVSFPGIDAERLVFMLESKGVLVATGSACAANKQTGSATLKAIGLEEDERNGSLRFSLGRLNDEENSKRAAQYIVAVVSQEYERVRHA
ncbi:MAG TPA: cysteine desulfurase family protein [Candidatus Saccharibacteria bacterium]|nr:cysteine desulfurase family protein [Candidatus Saccharibacteria bacterium]HMR38279.1 cysteine desulfurase family protein [Candidatus Saccharibacteria bacterium]